MTGTIPLYAAGTLLRTGPAFHKVDTSRGKYACSHWFDGFTTVYRFELQPMSSGSCKVMHSSRRQVDELVQHISQTGKGLGISFGQKRDPCESFFQKLQSTFDPIRRSSPGMTNIGVTIHTNMPGLRNNENGDMSIKNLVSFTDNSSIKLLDPKTLEPTGVTDQKSLHPDLAGPLSSAHAQFDPATKDCYNYNLDFRGPAVYRVFHVSAATGKTTVLASISGGDVKPCYIHSFFLTPSYVVLALWPAQFAKGGVKILWERNLLDAIAPFDPSIKTKWHVIDRVNGRGHLATFESPAFFAFHTANAWEEENEDGTVDILANIVQYPNMDILHKFYYENMIATGSGAEAWRGDINKNLVPSLVRYRLGSIDSKARSLKPTKVATAIMTIDGPTAGDLPTYNPNFAMKENRYVYSLCDRGKSSFVDGLSKVDTITQTSVVWSKEHHTPGEPIFIADPGQDGEDDGVVLSVVLDGDTGLSYLLCLDAKTFTETGRASVPSAIGFGFHGVHF